MNISYGFMRIEDYDEIYEQCLNSATKVLTSMLKTITITSIKDND